MFICELECRQQAKRFIHRATHRQVIDSLLTKNTFGRDDEEATKGDASVVPFFDQHLIVLGNGLGDVGDEGILETAETALVAGGVDPVEMREGGVDRAAQDFDANLLEVVNAIREGDDFGGADECPVQGIEEEHHIPGGEVGGWVSE